MPSRNDPCPCGSGRKYKRCCLDVDLERERAHGRLVEAVTAWAEEQYPGQIAASLVECLDGRPEATEEATNFAALWFLHEWELPGGETPLERYAADGPDAALRSLAGMMAAAKLALWRVIEVTPGQALAIEPYAGGEQVWVQSANISKVVGPFDLVLGRLRPDANELWGSSRCYSVRHEQALRHLLERLARRLAIDPDDVDQIVRRAPAELLSFRGPEPVPFTTEGDPVAFVTARWRIDRDDAVEAFNAAEGLVPEGPDAASYGWLAHRRELLELKPDALPPGAITFEANPIGMSDAVALGSFYIEREEVRYEGGSERRLAWALEMVADILPNAELIETETKARREYPASPAKAPDVAPEVVADLRASMTERWLSEPIPALEGLTPRQAASNGAYIPQLKSLLRGIAVLSANKLAIDIDTVIADLGITP